MKIIETITHRADPSRVFAMLTDPAYQVRRCERSGAADENVVVEPGANGEPTVITSRYLPTDDLADVVKPFVGNSLLVEEIVRWSPANADGERWGAMTMDFPGLPVTVTGGQRLRPGPEAGTCEQEVDADLEVNVPLVGQRIAEQVRSQIGRLVEMERDLAREWLATGETR